MFDPNQYRGGVDSVVGDIGSMTLPELADRASQLLVAGRSEAALCVDPDGLVSLQHPDVADAAEIVGVYLPVGGLYATYQRIRPDLAYEIGARA